MPNERRRLFRAYDHGYSKPFAAIWFLVASGDDLVFEGGQSKRMVKGDIVIVDELYGCLPGRPNTGLRLNPMEIARRMMYREVARGWRTKDGRSSIVRAGPADGIWDMTDGRDISTEFSGQGIEFEKPVKGPRTPGWALVRQYIQNACSDPKSGIRENSGLFVCERCVEWLRTVPVQPIRKIPMTLTAMPKTISATSPATLCNTTRRRRSVQVASAERDLLVRI